MSISERKRQANRANAQHSTGPKTDTGRQTVSQNRVIHGLCGAFRVLASENQSEYDDLLTRFIAAEKPADDVERELVAKMARHTWLSERAIRFQEACFLIQPQSEEQKSPDAEGRTRHSVGVMKDIDVYLRYQAHHDRAYQRAAGELARRREDRDLAARGFERQKREEAEAKRSEERQQQRTEIHPYRIATAKWQLERQIRRAETTKSANRPQQTTPATAQNTCSTAAAGVSLANLSDVAA